MKEDSASHTAAVLAAADDVRKRRLASSIFTCLSGSVLAAASLLLWPRALFSIVIAFTGGSLLVLGGGLAIFASGILLIGRGTRRMAKLRNNFSSVGKAHDAYTNEPNFNVPTIGVGHGTPLDSSVAQLANPSKLLPWRR